MQIRSADEPESRFYRCLKCELTWREEWWWWSFTSASSPKKASLWVFFFRPLTILQCSIYSFQSYVSVFCFSAQEFCIHGQSYLVCCIHFENFLYLRSMLFLCCISKRRMFLNQWSKTYVICWCSQYSITTLTIDNVVKTLMFHDHELRANQHYEQRYVKFKIYKSDSFVFRK